MKKEIKHWALCDNYYGGVGIVTLCDMVEIDKKANAWAKKHNVKTSKIILDPFFGV